MKLKDFRRELIVLLGFLLGAYLGWGYANNSQVDRLVQVNQRGWHEGVEYARKHISPYVCGKCGALADAEH
jgi:hypothetical protein